MGSWPSPAQALRPGIARRLGLTFALLFAVFAAAGGFALGGLLELHEALHEVEHDAHRMRDVLRLATAVRDQYAHVAHTIIIADDSHKMLYQEASRAVATIAERVSATADGDSERALVARLGDRSRELDDLFRDSLLPAVRRGDREATAALHERVLAVVEEAQKEADQLSERAERSIAAFGAHASAVQHVTIRGMLVSLVTSMLAALALGIYLHRSIARPVARLAAGAARIGSGDLQTPIEVSGNDEFGKLAEQFNAMTVSLKEHQDKLVRTEKLAGIGRLAAGVAHEINNPLAVVLGYAKLLQRKSEGEVAHDLAIIAQEAERCQQVVEDLLDLTRTPYAQTEAVDLRAIADEIVARLKVTLPSSESRVRATGRAVALGSPTKIRQVMHNLLKNGLEAAAPDGGVDIHIEQDGDQAVVEVVDAGPGLSPEQRDRVFEPFFTTKANGTGLGLAVSRAIARAHGGDLVFDERSGGGAFRLTLPLAGVPS